jgi:hypothetical protein
MFRGSVPAAVCLVILAAIAASGCCAGVRFHGAAHGPMEPAWEPQPAACAACAPHAIEPYPGSMAHLAMADVAQAVLLPPRSRYLPVPTRPVFAPRPEYSPAYPLHAPLPAAEPNGAWKHAEPAPAPPPELLPGPVVAPEGIAPPPRVPEPAGEPIAPPNAAPPPAGPAPPWPPAPLSEEGEPQPLADGLRSVLSHPAWESSSSSNSPLPLDPPSLTR